MELLCIPAFSNNYIWLLKTANKGAIIIDPGDAEPVIAQLTQQSLSPLAILLTHHHNDHTGGVAELVRQYPGLNVFGPEETKSKGSTNIVQDQQDINIQGTHFHVIAVPGHTLGHVAYYSPPYLFCGDTLFSGGCGRIFEGTPEQMYSSIEKISALPNDTKICCAHEYTLNNLKFARHLFPENNIFDTYEKQVIGMRQNGQPSVPTTLDLERNINLFLQCHNIDLQRKLGINSEITPTYKIFAQLRRLKDDF